MAKRILSDPPALFWLLVLTLVLGSAGLPSTKSNLSDGITPRDDYNTLTAACSPATCAKCTRDTREKYYSSKRAIPQPFDPPYQGDTENYINAILAESARQGMEMRLNNDVFYFHPTAFWFPFGERPLTVSFGGLYGCLVLIVVSQMGSWIGHFWEMPGISATEDPVSPASDEAFRYYILDVLNSRSNIWDFANLYSWTESGVFADHYEPKAYLYWRAPRVGSQFVDYNFPATAFQNFI